MSANFKENYEKSYLTGIAEFKKIDRLRYKREIIDAEYYGIVPKRVNVRPEPIEVVEGDSKRAICARNNPTEIDYGIKGLRMNLNGQEKTPDTFLTYTHCSGCFAIKIL